MGVRVLVVAAASAVAVLLSLVVACDGLEEGGTPEDPAAGDVVATGPGAEGDFPAPPGEAGNRGPAEWPRTGHRREIPGANRTSDPQAAAIFIAAMPPELDVLETGKLPPACTAAAELVRQRAIARMENAMDQALARFKLAWCVKSLLTDNPECDLKSPGMIKMLSGGGGAVVPPAPTGAQEYSDTNNQVDGVDEPDLVKTDGERLFVASGKALHVVAAWPPEHAKVEWKLGTLDEATRLTRAGKRAAVLTRGEGLLPDLPSLFECPTLNFLMGMFPGTSESGCLWGTDCKLASEAGKLRIEIFDFPQDGPPRLVRRISFPGALLGTRRVGHSLYAAAETIPSMLKDLPLLPPDMQSLAGMGPGSYKCLGLDGPAPLSGSSNGLPDAALAAFEWLKEKNRNVLLSAPAGAFLPPLTDTVYDGQGNVTARLVPVDCATLVTSPIEADGVVVDVVGFRLDLEQDEAVRTTLLAGPAAVYATPASLYLAVRQRQDTAQEWPYPDEWFGYATSLHRFALDPNTAEAVYAGHTAVEGNVVNQFALDEYAGHLRLATTTGVAGQSIAHSTVLVLNAEQSDLPLVGVLDGLAPNEDIRSARFLGPTGYVVTFKKMDPLFVIDMADPAAPTVLGKVDIPGFSTYIHPFSPGFLLTIGYSGGFPDAFSAFSFFSSIVLKVFDVSSPASPKESSVLTIATTGSYTDATVNHLAFHFYPQESVLAVPLATCSGTGYGNIGSNVDFNGLLLYRVTPGEGIVSLGELPHPVGKDFVEDVPFGCFNWWTGAPERVRRSVFMEDFVYSVSLSEVRVANIDSPDQLLASVPLN